MRIIKASAIGKKAKRVYICPECLSHRVSLKDTCHGKPIHFGSKAEGKRYLELRLLEKHGAIQELKTQPRYALVVGDATIAHYVADFEYTENGHKVIEDVKSKGVMTELSLHKIKHFEVQTGLKVRIV